MKGKQFVTNPSKKGVFNEAYFNPFNRLYEQEEYKLKQYRQEPVKPGFNSSNATRRDEFTHNIRAAQQRENLNKEFKPLKIKRKFTRELPPMENKPSVPLYDLVYEKTDPQGIPNWHKQVMKQPKDTQNPTLFGNERNLGTYKTTSSEIGYGTGTIFDLQHKLK